MVTTRQTMVALASSYWSCTQSGKTNRGPGFWSCLGFLLKSMNLEFQKKFFYFQLILRCVTLWIFTCRCSTRTSSSDSVERLLGLLNLPPPRFSVPRPPPPLQYRLHPPSTSAKDSLLFKSNPYLLSSEHALNSTRTVFRGNTWKSQCRQVSLLPQLRTGYPGPTGPRWAAQLACGGPACHPRGVHHPHPGGEHDLQTN